MPATEFAEDVQQRTQILIDQTKEYHAVLFEIQGLLRPEGQSCAAERNGLLFCPIADSQGSKISIREYRWIGPFVVQKVLSNDNYIVRRFNTNKTQILNRII